MARTRIKDDGTVVCLCDRYADDGETFMEWDDANSRFKCPKCKTVVTDLHIIERTFNRLKRR